MEELLEQPKQKVSYMVYAGLIYKPDIDFRKKIKPHQILKTVCDFYDVPVEFVLSRTRKNEAAMPRQITAYLCRKYLQSTLKEIGALIGERDHTSAYHGIQKVAGLMHVYPEFRLQMRNIESLFNREI